MFGNGTSFSGRRWVLRQTDESAVRALTRNGVSDMLARLLAVRGVQPDGLADAIEPTLKRLLPEPRGLADMDKAVSRTLGALEGGEHIAIFGDYDVDGSSSVAILAGFFAALGRPVRIYVPDRMTEGYGPSSRALQRLQDEGASLVVTVDCGAGAIGPLESARSTGLDVIVLDHHAVELAIPAFAHVNPNRPEDSSGLGHLCAAGVTFLFTVALNRVLRESGWYAAQGIPEPDLRTYVDLVGLATICDVVPLVGVNRAFVRTALPKFAERPGLAALAAVANVNAPFTPYHLGFVFGPRINAGGRIGRSSLGAELLSAQTAAEAEPLARLLDRHNRERQAIESVILEEAMAEAAAMTDSPFIFVAGEGWHAGVVGIVASRLKERFAKPAFVAGLEGGLGRGSARSLAGFDIGAAVRAARGEGILEAGGGHAMAAGFSLTAAQVGPFQEFLTRWFAERGDLTGSCELGVDVTISLSGANETLAQEIARIGPFGPGNPEPICAARDVTVAFADIVGQNHIRLRLAASDGARLDGIAFRAADQDWGRALLKARGQRVHAAGYLRSDTWNGRQRVQLQLEDAAPASA